MKNITNIISSSILNNWQKIKASFDSDGTKKLARRNDAIFSAICFAGDKGQSIWNDRNYEQFAENGYQQNVIAYYATNLVAKSVASVPLVLARYTRQGERNLIHQHKILELMKRPNPFVSGTYMIEQLAMHQMLSGNAYVLKIRNHSGRIQELHVLRPDRVFINTTNDKITSYKYIVGNTTREYKVDSVTGKCDIMHIKNFHPTSDIYGLSMFEAASYSIDQHNQASVWTQSLLKNSARPSGALIVKGENGGHLTEEQYNKLKAQMDDFFSGYQNSGRPILLEGGLEWKEMSLKPKDMDFVEAKYSMARDIALTFGVPSYLLGIPGDNTYSNLSEANAMMWRQTILPMLSNILSCFSSWLTTDFAMHNTSLEFDEDKISVFSENRERLWDKLNNVKFLTLNEKRSMMGFPPIDDEDITL